MSLRFISLTTVGAACCAAFGQTEVNQNNMNALGWFSQTNGTATTGFASGPASPPIGFGSGVLSPGSIGASGAQMRNTFYSGTRLDSLTALSYSTFTFTGIGQTPLMCLHIDFNGDQSVDDQLF